MQTVTDPALAATIGNVEQVAFWVGFVGSIIGIVLSVVAIVFSILVDRRSSSVSDQVIRSLQKIESAVERSSSDTRELIKAGWDKMLGSVETSSLSAPNDVPAREIAAGIAAELRAELSHLSKAAGSGPVIETKGLEQAIQSLQASIASQLSNAPAATRPSEAFDRVLRMLAALPPNAQAVVREITGHHLSMEEYRALSRGSLRDALQGLRETGLLIPVVHKLGEGKEVPCYYFPPSIAHMVRAALPLVPMPSPDVTGMVRTELRAVGYPSDHDGHSHAELRR